MCPCTNFTHLFDGLDVATPLADGHKVRYTNFDNAASTPPFKAVMEAVNSFMAYYSSVHRGTGFKSQLSTHVYEQARQVVLGFVGADENTHTVIFGKNTTEALNKLAHRFPFTTERNVVITTGMEHHSNDLPWRAAAEVVHIGMTDEGRPDLDAFDAALKKYADRVALVTVTGGSNVTGYINPIHDLAGKAHAVGAQFCADCAQLAPHRKVEMLPLDDPRHLDYVSISAHKLYAPFGTGALIGRRDIFETGDPDMVGGGVVQIVTLEDEVWASPPDREEAGSPNHVGAIALAAALQQLSAIGMDNVAAHEAELTSHALRGMAQVPGIQIYGDTDPANAANRLGVIPFALEGMSHFKLAAILGNEFGVGVRNGCFCAHPYILELLKIDKDVARQVRRQILNNDRAEMPGLVRASFGLYNTQDEVDHFVKALQVIADGEYHGEYRQDTASGEFFPVGYQPDFSDYFDLADYGKQV